MCSPIVPDFIVHYLSFSLTQDSNMSQLSNWVTQLCRKTGQSQLWILVEWFLQKEVLRGFFMSGTFLRPVNMFYVVILLYFFSSRCTSISIKESSAQHFFLTCKLPKGTLLYEMPSNPKGKKFVSKIYCYCP